ncbi:MAG: LytTR family DNA-binding domain-containing protein [Prevotella sp.]|jgi:DNA-binding LytR/AlgR family response regulator|nr:LytTR family DNA-binding domain-containing protein [Prevotella sp.]
MKCIAIDDEPLALKLLAHYCSRISFVQLLGAYTDPLEGISYIRSMQPDLIFLDIRMPDFSGINIAQVLDKKTLIIFTTAHKEYAVEGFDLDVVDYLLKPFGFERFLKACNKAKQRFSLASKPPVAETLSDGDTLVFKYNYQNICLPLHSILYIEACNNYIRIVTPDKVYMPTMTMKTIRKLLPETEFIRLHKSFIVAVGKIKSFNSEQVITDYRQIPVGRSYRKDFLEQMEALKQGF